MPTLGEMFVAFQSPGRTHIDKLLMKGGSDRTHVIESGLSQNGQISIAVDEANQKVYWSDSEKLKIEFSSFERTNIKIFATTERKPGALALIGGKIYWTSLESSILQWRNATGSGDVKATIFKNPPGMRKPPNMIAIAAEFLLRSSNHSCTNDNGGCSDICISNGLQVTIIGFSNYFHHPFLWNSVTEL